MQCMQLGKNLIFPIELTNYDLLQYFSRLFFRCRPTVHADVKCLLKRVQITRRQPRCQTKRIFQISAFSTSSALTTRCTILLHTDTCETTDVTFYVFKVFTALHILCRAVIGRDENVCLPVGQTREL